MNHLTFFNLPEINNMDHTFWKMMDRFFLLLIEATGEKETRPWQRPYTHPGNQGL
jgi:hypothetical protein